jgi:hypothetical protein
LNSNCKTESDNLDGVIHLLAESKRKKNDEIARVKRQIKEQLISNQSRGECPEYDHFFYGVHDQTECNS